MRSQPYFDELQTFLGETEQDDIMRMEKRSVQWLNE